MGAEGGGAPAHQTWSPGGIGFGSKATGAPGARVPSCRRNRELSAFFSRQRHGLGRNAVEVLERRTAAVQRVEGQCVDGERGVRGRPDDADRPGERGRGGEPGPVTIRRHCVSPSFDLPLAPDCARFRRGLFCVRAPRLRSPAPRKIAHHATQSRGARLVSRLGLAGDVAMARCRERRNWLGAIPKALRKVRLKVVELLKPQAKAISG